MVHYYKLVLSLVFSVSGLRLICTYFFPLVFELSATVYFLKRPVTKAGVNFTPLFPLTLTKPEYSMKGFYSRPTTVAYIVLNITNANFVSISDRFQTGSKSLYLA